MLLTHRNIAMIGLFGAVSIVLGIIENILPMPLPGVRLGLANLGVMMMLYLGGTKSAFLVMLLKMTLVPVLSGNLIFRMSLSIPSGLAAFIGMLFCALLLYKYTSPVSTGVAGAVLHMLTQLWIIDHLYIRGIFSTAIVGWFLLAAVITGILTGLITTLAVNRLKKIMPVFP